MTKLEELRELIMEGAKLSDSTTDKSVRDNIENVLEHLYNEIYVKEAKREEERVAQAKIDNSLIVINDAIGSYGISKEDSHNIIVDAIYSIDVNTKKIYTHRFKITSDCNGSMYKVYLDYHYAICTDAANVIELANFINTNFNISNEERARKLYDVCQDFVLKMNDIKDI